MELKNAVAVCLISLFSATLVVLIARALDNQAASRLEPQLASIVQELRALRGQGGVAAVPGAAADTETIGDGVVVYYFHGNTRCPTCRSIESQAHETVRNQFTSQLSAGEVSWKTLNFEQPAGRPLAAKFEISSSTVVLAKVKDGQVADWKRLEQVWALEGDKPAFAEYVSGEIEKMLAADEKPRSAADQTPGSTIPIPKADSAPAKQTPAIPIPQE
jgi:hypothetical protein